MSVHNTWKCGHARRPYNGLGGATTPELEALAKRVSRPEWIRAEIRERGRNCPACRASDRRAFRQALWITLLVILGLTVTCAARGASDCAPYTPADGRTCQPPTRLREWKGQPVCVCLPAEVANR